MNLANGLIEGMGHSDKMGLYVNDQFVCTGPMEKLMLVSRQHCEPGDKVSFRAVDDETASKEHRSGKGANWDQPVSRTIRRAIERARQKLQKRHSTSSQDE